ncbi:MAG: phage Gp37/Gp68 family protein [Armatimonadetes bacterium]|nr:phage Gp37/Gp68 family protein [Armatimonadota bacterium]
MGQHSAIEWTHATWNPVTGCSPHSAGCAHCYAQPIALRLQADGQPNYRRGFEVTTQPQLLDQPLHWRRPRWVFVCSMADLFHHSVPESFIASVFETMRSAEQHVFQVLTKRAERLAELAPKLPWPAHIWAGVTIERRDYAYRADLLRAVPAAVRWLSCEPLLGPLPDLDLTGIDWVVAGGESGPRARPMALDWARGLRDQSAAAGASYWLKQLGGWPDKRGGEQARLDGRLHTQRPEPVRTRQLALPGFDFSD